MSERPWLTPGWLEDDARLWAAATGKPRAMYAPYRRHGELDARLRRLGLEAPRRLTRFEVIDRLDAAKTFPSR